jgi:hypothetical protein
VNRANCTLDTRVTVFHGGGSECHLTNDVRFAISGVPLVDAYARIIDRETRSAISGRVE